MSLIVGQAAFLLPHSTLRPRIIPSRQHHRPWKRRRLKPLLVLNLVNPDLLPFEELFHGLISQISSGNSIGYIAPTLGLLSGLALIGSSNSQASLPNSEVIGKINSDIGEWILFTSPTPFNRFVTLRCPSICFPESEMMENLNEKLVKEDRHYVKLKTGRMNLLVNRNAYAYAYADADENFEYQRVCLGAEDGGVLSLDWPANLDLEEEHGLDSTILVIPGTAEGSNETKIRGFVCECLRRGVFPVVMNPRGCAGSPLTTARLFTAADSDDVTTAVQFINTKRPLTTLMGVGWGYGANMLTKHLAECGEKTPLTVATCIDNPFDLDEATRCLYHLECDQRHTDGLIKILERNKELFQGRDKGFDVERALSSSSIQEFDRAISMVSHGFNAIEDFYAKCSTRYVVGKVKVPVLFIQNDDGKIPLSVPRDLIAENSYTSLLVCCYSPSSKVINNQLLFSWCESLALEWLAAVELALLKGRHPLLEDDDVTINPSKRLSLVESRDSRKGGRIDKFLNLANVNPAMSPVELFHADDTGEIHLKFKNGIWDSLPSPKASQQEASTNDDQSNPTIDPVVQSAHVVLNMLDITLPGTLSDGQKKRVLNAVGQGETLLKALQDAVPEEVRGKLTTAVHGILQSHGTDLTFDKLSSLGNIPRVASALNSKVQEKIKKTKVKSDEDAHSVGEAKGTPDDSHDKTPRDAEHVVQSSELPSEPRQPGNHSRIRLENYGPELETVNLRDMGNSLENEELSRESQTQISDAETMSVLNSNQEFSGISKGSDEAGDIVANQRKDDRVSGKYQLDMADVNNNHQMDSQTHQVKILEANQTGDQSSAASKASEVKAMDSETEKNEKEKGPMPSGDSPSFSVSQALDALTGFDDSTQVAVNSVFHVIEDVIDKLEVEKDKENQVKDDNSVSEIYRTLELKELSTGSVSDNNVMKNDYRSAKTLDLRINARKHSGDSDCNFLGDEEMSNYEYNQQLYSHVEHNGKSCERDHKSSQFGTENEINFLPGEGELPVRNSVDNKYEKVLSYLAIHPYKNPLYKEYLNAYLNLKMRNAEPSGENKMPALYLDYFPEEGQWKFLDQTEENSASVKKYSTSESGSRKVETNTNSRSKNADKIIDPSYVVLDSGKALSQTVVPEGVGITPEKFGPGVMEFENYKLLIKNLILECLKVEVGRRASMADKEEVKLKLVQEMEYIANAVSMAAGQGKICVNKEKENQKEKVGTVDWENIVKAISSAIQHTIYLRRVLPVGVVVGASLVELRKFFNNNALAVNGLTYLAFDKDDISAEGPVQFSEKEGSERVVSKRETVYNLAGSTVVEEDLEISQNNEVMVSAVAALGASAFLAHEKNTEIAGSLNVSPEKKDNSKETSKPDGTPEKNQENIVTSLAEKAMSVASPMVPMKEDGELDHDRMVAMLTELGQKGGFLKLFGKVALLWGGMRGALSLTNKLISFLRIAERPLIHRIPGFVFMVLLLWSPVILPLLPALMQSWATHNPFKVAEFACIAGLYASTMLMIMLWGKRIRKYEDPLVQYGLDLTSVPKFQNFLKGLLGGIGLIILIHSVNTLLGYAHLCWPATLHSSTSEPVALIRSYGRMLVLILQGFATATGLSVVEELLFRSWLPQEIATDFGYHHGVVISALVFALSQRSKWEIPGLWLLSLCLSGARQRSRGSLSLPIGLHAGILASNFIFRTGGFVTYHPNLPKWIAGGQPFQPFSGVVGLAFSLFLAVILYPKKPVNQRKSNRVIRF